jgi:hypothetical protein
VAALRSWGLDDVVTALNKFKEHQPLRPEDRRRSSSSCRGMVGDEQKKAAVAEQPFSEMVAAQMGIQKSVSPIEKLMRYWRQLWWTYKTNAERRRASMDLATAMVAEREACDVADVRGRRSFVESVATWEAQFKGALNKCVISCAACIVAEVEGMTIEKARDYADWIETNPDQFRSFLAALRAEELAESFT